MNHLSEEQLILYHYGEAEDRDQIAQHLDACDSCRANCEDIARTLRVVQIAPIPKRNESYGTEVWQRLRSHLPDGAAQTPSRWKALVELLKLPRWAVAGALGVLLLGAFLAGRFWPRSAPNALDSIATSIALGAGQARERILLKEIGDHLERSQLALIELIHSKTKGVVDISVEQALARQLADVNRLYRQTATRLGEVGMASLLDDLERTLVEISNGPAQLSSAKFADLRQRIDSEDLLFKVKVASSQVRAKEEDAAHALAAKRS